MQGPSQGHPSYNVNALWSNTDGQHSSASEMPEKYIYPLDLILLPIAENDNTDLRAQSQSSNPSPSCDM